MSDFYQLALYIAYQQYTNMNKSCLSPKFTYLAHVCFFLFGLVYIIGPSLEIRWFSYFKVLPLVIMIVLLLGERKNGSTILMVVGLIFGTIGDLVLQHGGDDLFAVGAGVFLINHILYNIYFLSLWQGKEGETLYKRRGIAFIFCILLISISSINMVTAFTDKTKDQNGILVYLLPVYMVILGMTAINPILLALSSKNLESESFLLVVGGICYYISDNLLGRTKFASFAIFGVRRINSILIMTTYYLAQYFIPLGFIKRISKVEKDSLEKSLISETESHQQ